MVNFKKLKKLLKIKPKFFRRNIFTNKPISNIKLNIISKTKNLSKDGEHRKEISFFPILSMNKMEILRQFARKKTTVKCNTKINVLEMLIRMKAAAR